MPAFFLLLTHGRNRLTPPISPVEAEVSASVRCWSAANSLQRWQRRRPCCGKFRKTATCST